MSRNSQLFHDDTNDIHIRGARSLSIYQILKDFTDLTLDFNFHDTCNATKVNASKFTIHDLWSSNYTMPQPSMCSLFGTLNKSTVRFVFLNNIIKYNIKKMIFFCLFYYINILVTQLILDWPNYVEKDMKFWSHKRSKHVCREGCSKKCLKIQINYVMVVMIKIKLSQNKNINNECWATTELYN